MWVRFPPPFQTTINKTKMKLIRKLLKFFKREPKEASFIDKPIKTRTINPERRGLFNDEENYYSRIKKY